jgi:hypothetical protein
MRDFYYLLYCSPYYFAQKPQFGTVVADREPIKV